MPLVVGVDAGATRTIAAAARDEASVQTFEGGPANPHVHGIDAAVETIAQTIAAVSGAEMPKAIAVGSAGAARERIAESIARALRASFPGARVLVTHDARIALRAAVRAGNGIVLIAGTGSIAYAERGERAFRAGGGGYALGDAGSGFAVGSAALQQLLRHFDGRAPSDPLLDALKERFGLADPSDLIAYVYDSESPVTAVAGIAPLVLEFADASARSAVKIVQTAALELFELVRAVCRAMDAESGELPLAFAGGLLQRNGLLTYLIETRLANELPSLRILKGNAPPYVGALALARALLHDGSRA